MHLVSQRASGGTGNEAGGRIRPFRPPSAPGPPAGRRRAGRHPERGVPRNAAGGDPAAFDMVSPAARPSSRGQASDPRTVCAKSPPIRSCLDSGVSPRLRRRGTGRVGLSGPERSRSSASAPRGGRARACRGTRRARHARDGAGAERDAGGRAPQRDRRPRRTPGRRRRAGPRRPPRERADPHRARCAPARARPRGARLVSIRPARPDRQASRSGGAAQHRPAACLSLHHQAGARGADRRHRVHGLPARSAGGGGGRGSRGHRGAARPAATPPRRAAPAPRRPGAGDAGAGRTHPGSRESNRATPGRRAPARGAHRCAAGRAYRRRAEHPRQPEVRGAARQAPLAGRGAPCSHGTGPPAAEAA